MEYMDFFGIDFWTMIFTWVNMFILYNVLKKLLYKPVTDVLARRENEIKKIYDDANTASRNASALEQEYTLKMATSNEEARAIIRNATASAQRREEEIILQAQEKAAAITKKAEAEMAQERKKAYREIKGEIADISTAIAEKMVGREITATDHAALIEEFIGNVGE